MLPKKRLYFNYEKESVKSKMDGFPILSLPPVLLEKTITKLEEKSYFRLQQTCRIVYEFIQTSKNISVHLNRDLSYRFHGRLLRFPAQNSLDIASVHGTRLFFFNTWRKSQEILSQLQNYKITCRFVDINRTQWDHDHCASLLKTLQPEIVQMRCEEPKQCDALLRIAALRQVALVVNWEDAVAAANSLLPAIRHLEMQIYARSLQSPQFRLFSLLREMVQVLRSASIVKMKILRMNIPLEEESLPTKEELLLEMRDLGIIPLDDTYPLHAEFKIPEKFPTGTFCEIYYRGRHVQLFFRQGAM